ncbi:MAG TPA: hypothetical protein PLQ41_09675 [bacterium]|nr:hypothetical protein [bacterium]HPP29450.1 hypothetical protein [bacterium]
MVRKMTFFGFIIILFLSPLYSAVPRFEYKVQGEDVFFMTEGNIFLVQPVSIVSGGSMLYFAAQDSTLKRDLTVSKTKEIKVLVDQADRKVVKATYFLSDEKNNIYKDYELVLFLEI